MNKSSSFKYQSLFAFVVWIALFSSLIVLDMTQSLVLEWLFNIVFYIAPIYGVHAGVKAYKIEERRMFPLLGVMLNGFVIAVMVAGGTSFYLVGPV